MPSVDNEQTNKLIIYLRLFLS